MRPWFIGHDGRAPPRAGHPDGHTERRLSAQAGQRARALRRARKQIWISVPSARARLSSVLATCVHPPDWILCAAAKATGGCRLAIRIRGAIVRPPSSRGNFRNGHLPISRTLFVAISSVDGYFAPDDSARCSVLHLDASIAVFINTWTVRADT